ncbi:MAG: plasmid pRiA4b ORF-3 family protein [Chitinivibrionales bacterium]
MSETVYQIRIHLCAIEPAIWRRIQIPSSYNFWDLHVAIQDAMGWEDRHLHQFRIPVDNSKAIMVGVPFQQGIGGGAEVIAGWKVPVSEYLVDPGATIVYRYDFSAGWKHTVTLEAVLPEERFHTYPRCTDGERACPPEKVMGVAGYYRFLESLKRPQKRMSLVLQERIVPDYDPEAFDPAAVRFDDPAKRWERTFRE